MLSFWSIALSPLEFNFMNKSRPIMGKCVSAPYEMHPTSQHVKTSNNSNNKNNMEIMNKNSLKIDIPKDTIIIDQEAIVTSKHIDAWESFDYKNHRAFEACDQLCIVFSKLKPGKTIHYVINDCLYSATKLHKIPNIGNIREINEITKQKQIFYPKLHCVSMTEFRFPGSYNSDTTDDTDDQNENAKKNEKKKKIGNTADKKQEKGEAYDPKNKNKNKNKSKIKHESSQIESNTAFKFPVSNNNTSNVISTNKTQPNKSKNKKKNSKKNSNSNKNKNSTKTKTKNTNKNNYDYIGKEYKHDIIDAQLTLGLEAVGAM